jgi:hypothetical protein
MFVPPIKTFIITNLIQMKHLSLLFLVALLPYVLVSQVQNNNFDFGSYQPFDLEGGYEVGSFINIIKGSAQAPLITKTDLDRRVIDKSILTLSSPTPIPATTFTRTTSFLVDLESKSKYAELPADLKASLERVSEVTIKVDQGSRYHLANGSESIIDILYALPLQDLNILQQKLKQRKAVHMISEVIKYENAKLEFKWASKVETELTTQIAKAIDIGVDADWVDNKTLVINYSKGTLVGYKSVKITRKQRRLIQERIEYRKQFGDDKAFYRDADGDGYGNPQERIVSLVQPTGYVADNCDCYDQDANAHPGQEGYFTAPRKGDSSPLQYDYNCNGKIDLQYDSNGRCQGGSALQGWDGKIPRPGQTGQWLADCDRKPLRGTVMERVARKQAGR